jgi:hypothetical protein
MGDRLEGGGGGAQTDAAQLLIFGPIPVKVKKAWSSFNLLIFFAPPSQKLRYRGGELKCRLFITILAINK